MSKKLERLNEELNKLHGAKVAEEYGTPPGSFDIGVRISGHMFALRFYSDHATYAVYDVEQQTFDTGPADYFKSFDDAAARLIELVRDAAPFAATARS